MMALEVGAAAGSWGGPGERRLLPWERGGGDTQLAALVPSRLVTRHMGGCVAGWLEQVRG